MSSVRLVYPSVCCGRAVSIRRKLPNRYRLVQLCWLCSVVSRLARVLDLSVLLLSACFPIVVCVRLLFNWLLQVVKPVSLRLSVWWWLQVVKPASQRLSVFLLQVVCVAVVAG